MLNQQENFKHIILFQNLLVKLHLFCLVQSYSSYDTYDWCLIVFSSACLLPCLAALESFSQPIFCVFRCFTEETFHLCFFLLCAFYWISLDLCTSTAVFRPWFIYNKSFRVFLWWRFNWQYELICQCIPKPLHITVRDPNLFWDLCV